MTHDDVRPQLPTVVPGREPLTEAEARVIGHAATHILQLRSLRHDTARGGNLTLGTNATLCLTTESLQAVLSLLIEREGATLSAFGIILDEPTQ